jgi:sugar lactone lactonase YvrE
MRLAASFAAITLGLMAANCTPTGSAVIEPRPTAVAPSAAPRPSAKLIATFDVAQGQLPEGLSVTREAAYVGFAPTGLVAHVDTSTGQTSPFGQLPRPVPGKGFMTGLAQAASGDIYAGLASFVPEVEPGIYRIDAAGGQATLFAKHAALPFPNGLAFDRQGDLFVTDSGTGSVFRITSDGSAERWAKGEALNGDKEACDKAGPGFAIGANGIVVEPDAVYVSNLDQATLVKIPREASGRAGAPVVIAGPDCAALGGADGLARAPDGSFVVAINRQNKLVRVRESGSVETLASGAPFDFPASVAFRGQSLFTTNFALRNASSGKPAAAGLVQLSQ